MFEREKGKSERGQRKKEREEQKKKTPHHVAQQPDDNPGHRAPAQVGLRDALVEAGAIRNHDIKHLARDVLSLQSVVLPPLDPELAHGLEEPLDVGSRELAPTSEVEGRPEPGDGFGVVAV